MDYRDNSSAIHAGTLILTRDYDYYGNYSAREAFPWDYGYNIRHSIFLITGMCVGLPLVVWVLCVQRHHKLSGRRTSVFVTTLLLTDLVEMVLSPVILLSQAVRGNGPISLLFFGVRYCGLHFHQMVALEGVMARTYLPISFLCLWRLLSILFCLTEGVFLLFCLFFHPFAQTTTVTLCWLLVAVIILGATSKLTFTSTTSTSESSVTVQEEDHMVLTVATLSFFTLYGPFLALEFAKASIPPASFQRHANGILIAMAMVHPAVCLRLLVDPILCFLVVRQLPLDRQRQESLSHDN